MMRLSSLDLTSRKADMSIARASLFMVCLVVASCATAPSGEPLPLPMATSPESVGLSSEQLANIETVTARHIESGTLPGAVMLVARKGRIAWFKTMGYRDRASGDPMKPDSIFRIYSMTKPIVTVAAMMLIEEGRLALDDPVSKYLPQMAAMKVGTEKTDSSGKPILELVTPEREMTILDLMRHTSGLIYGGRGKSLVNDAYRKAGIGSREFDNREQVTRIATVPLRFTPGSRWEYGVSTDVLGRIVEVIEGESLGRVLQRRIFTPLDMRDTAFFVALDKLPRAAQAGQKAGGAPMTVRFDVAQQPAFESAGSGLTSTMRDYLRFTTMLINGGEFEGKRILRRQSIALMTRDHLGKTPGMSDANHRGFGLGFEVRKAAGEPGKTGLAGEYGWSGNAGTIFFVDPKRELIGIYLVQVSDEDRIALRNEFRSLVHGAVIE
jgi:CubicO group peptidase (beta-lactamase class C family)